MPRDITKGVSGLSIHQGKMDAPVEKPQRNSKSYRLEQWIYGFHLKNRQCRIIAQKYGLPWKKQSLITTERIIQHITFASGTRFRLRFVDYRDGKAMILFFVVADGRKRIKDSMASPEEIDKVRKLIGLPKGTTPKWYNCYGCDDYDNAADSSEDEARPVQKTRAPSPPEEPSEMTSGSAHDGDSTMAGKSEDECDRDETSSDDDSEEDDTHSEG